jgi:hypothetical protein
VIEKLDRAAWSRLSEAAAADLAPIFADGQAALGAEGQKLARKSLPKLSLSAARAVQDVANIIVLLDASGQYTAAVSAVDKLRPVPFTGNQTIFEPIRQMFALAFRRLSLLGSPEAKSWEPLLSFAENGGEPGPVVIREATTRRLAGQLLRQHWRGDPTGVRAAHIANICAEVRELVTMWALGGSAAWPRPKIDEEIGHNVDTLRQLDAV